MTTRSAGQERVGERPLLQQPDGNPQNPLGDIYCVSFFREPTPIEVLRRFGGPGEPSAREMTFEELLDGPLLVGAIDQSLG
ncbi:hypothetical protein ACTWPT_36520 [Nonomuraea sp. 3N208]|uniref:hypothetical protein n=1 Tax=Nonomuraea sp. 3N208 TaxID=3457421 RepID=UPI003FD3BDD2